MVRGAAGPREQSNRQRKIISSPSDHWIWWWSWGFFSPPYYLPSHMRYPLWPLLLNDQWWTGGQQASRLLSNVPTSNTLSLPLFLSGEAKEAHPVLNIFFMPATLSNHPSSFFVPFFHPIWTLSADSYFKLASKDLSSNEDKFQLRWTSSDDGSSDYGSPGRSPPWTSLRVLEVVGRQWWHPPQWWWQRWPTMMTTMAVVAAVMRKLWTINSRWNDLFGCLIIISA